jgi:hypothetical protein
VIFKSQDLFLHGAHNHLFEPEGDSSSVLKDRMEYSLALGILDKVISQTIVKRKLKEMFECRHRITNQDIYAHNDSASSKNSSSNIIPMTLLLTGSTGFIGSSLASFFTTGGYKIIRLLRSQSQLQSQQLENTTQKSVHWDPITGSIDIQMFATKNSPSLSFVWIKLISYYVLLHYNISGCSASGCSESICAARA